MRILSYNVRGLGSRAKCNDVGEIISKRRVNFCMLQESKKEDVDEFLCRAIWNVDNIDWAFKGSDDRSGGLLSIWNRDVFAATSSWDMEGALIVNGRWGSERKECCIINIYASCLTVEKIELWDRLNLVISQNSLAYVCVGGDFNAVRRGAERVRRRM